MNVLRDPIPLLHDVLLPPGQPLPHGLRPATPVPAARTATSAATSAATFATPAPATRGFAPSSAHPHPADDAASRGARLRSAHRSLASALRRHPQSGRLMPHLAALERSMARHGSVALRRLDVPVLQRALRQLEWLQEGSQGRERLPGDPAFGPAVDRAALEPLRERLLQAIDARERWLEVERRQQAAAPDRVPTHPPRIEPRSEPLSEPHSGTHSGMASWMDSRVCGSDRPASPSPSPGPSVVCAPTPPAATVAPDGRWTRFQPSQLPAVDGVGASSRRGVVLTPAPRTQRPGAGVARSSTGHDAERRLADAQPATPLPPRTLPRAHADAWALAAVGAQAPDAGVFSPAPMPPGVAGQALDQGPHPATPVPAAANHWASVDLDPGLATPEPASPVTTVAAAVALGRPWQRTEPAALEDVAFDLDPPAPHAGLLEPGLAMRDGGWTAMPLRKSG